MNTSDAAESERAKLLKLYGDAVDVRCARPPCSQRHSHLLQPLSQEPSAPAPTILDRAWTQMRTITSP
jgi:hypothetical protein